ncbi:MAG: AAA family ATPase [Candidatus Omnitrophica bacterium]|nr:AAA family ATPase [Candidatus Omnitrophota bacterium]
MASQAPINFAELDFNDQFMAAFEALENTSQHLFVTGKAGTGKSTLLQYFRHKTTKSIAVLAPTGVAALNIKGQTIHSFFQFKPDITPEAVNDIIIRKTKRKMYEELDAIVIDEISMVRADLLDCIDAFLRLFGKDYNKPFGGIQMIFLGDMYQLPPVVSKWEEEIFKSHYLTPYFFSAKILPRISLKIVELKKIYRQKDEGFIHLLNAVRHNQLEDHHLHAFNTRHQSKVSFNEGDFYITLTTTNSIAETVNANQLRGLPGKDHVYQGAVSGDFEKKSFPTQETLAVKKGAQVMMLNNDSEKRWVNGSLGIVVEIKATSGDDIIMVKLENGQTVDVKRHTWEIYQYFFDTETDALASKVIGHFTQYPFKLAWAVTIHKSQGQTFERVMIDVGFGTFAHGQMYVALSRCTSLEGIILRKPIAKSQILMDNRIHDFMTKSFDL